MKKYKIIFWIATTLVFLFEGIMPLATLIFAPQYATAGTAPLGYPDYFAYALIICKIAGVTALMIPRLNATVREWAYAGLFFNLIFATYSHIVVDQNTGYILTPVVVGLVLAVSYRCNRKVYRHG